MPVRRRPVVIKKRPIKQLAPGSYPLEKAGEHSAAHDPELWMNHPEPGLVPWQPEKKRAPKGRSERRPIRSVVGKGKVMPLLRRAYAIGAPISEGQVRERERVLAKIKEIMPLADIPRAWLNEAKRR